MSLPEWMEPANWLPGTTIVTRRGTYRVDSVGTGPAARGEFNELVRSWQDGQVGVEARALVADVKAHVLDPLPEE